jgi:hypothetical protein
MKTALYGVLLGALLATGCLSQLPFAYSPQGNGTSADTGTQARKHVAPVRPDQVTAENAPQKAQQLEEELDNDLDAPE